MHRIKQKSKTGYNHWVMSNNVLLVTADSLRADYCGFLGGPETTPYLSKLADNSAVYESAISPGPRTPSSIALTHTGERFRNVDADTNEGRLKRIADHIRRFETIPERLAAQGYSTGAVTANPWTVGFDEPFDEFVAIGEGYESESDSTERSIIDKGLDYVEQWRKGTDWFAQCTSFDDEVHRLIQELPEPWFIWVFLMDTHSPYIVPRQHLVESNVATMYYSALRYNASVMRGQDVSSLPSHLDRYLKRAYRDAIRLVDTFVEQVHQEVPSNTALIFHSDHGEAFGEHGTYGHQEVLYEENIHVPLLVHDGTTSGQFQRPASTLEIPSIVEQTAKENFDGENVTNDIAFAQTGDGSMRAARTPSHWFVSDGEQVLCQDTRNRSDYGVVQDEEVATAVANLFEAEFAPDAEKSQVISAIEDASFSSIR